MSDTETLVSQLAELVQERNDIHQMLRDEHPGAYERLDELEKEVQKLSDSAKEAVRALGPGQHDFGGNVIQVRNPRIKRVPDVEGILDRAEERGELDDLIDAEVLSYQVNLHMLERLDGTMKAIYSSYIDEEEGTPSVVLPAQLK